jgi:predicted RNA-binding protein Jag
MKVEIFRLTGEPVTIDVQENGTVKDVFSHPDSGKVIGREGSLLEAAEEAYGMTLPPKTGPVIMLVLGRKK